MSTTQSVKLECRSCGGPVKLSIDGLFATCVYCGSKQWLQQDGGSQFDRLCDFPNATFAVRHVPPVLTSKDALECITESFADDPLADKAVRAEEMKTELGFLPVWVIGAVVHCTWTGRYAENRTVQKLKTAAFPLGGSSSGGNTLVPYDTVETSWHRQSGAHDFRKVTYRAANGAFAGPVLQLLANTAAAAENARTGVPRDYDGFEVLPATATQREAWSDWEKSLQRCAPKECQGVVQVLETVSPTLSASDFTLTFVPYCSVHYEVQGRTYRHVFDLVTGYYTGDLLALDASAISLESLRAEAKEKRSAQKEIDEKRSKIETRIASVSKTITRHRRAWGWISVILFGASIFGAAMPNERAVLFIGSAIAFTIYIVYASRTGSRLERIIKRMRDGIPTGTPWNDFVMKERISLLRVARLACGSDVKPPARIETYGVLTDTVDVLDRFAALQDLETDEQRSLAVAGAIAEFLTHDQPPPVPPPPPVTEEEGGAAV